MWFERFATQRPAGRRGHLGAGIILRGIKEIRHKAVPCKPGCSRQGQTTQARITHNYFTFERHMRRCMSTYAPARVSAHID